MVIFEFQTNFFEFQISFFEIQRIVQISFFEIQRIVLWLLNISMLLKEKSLKFKDYSLEL